jgi:uncharacterized protein YacL
MPQEGERQPIKIQSFSFGLLVRIVFIVSIGALAAMLLSRVSRELLAEQVPEGFKGLPGTISVFASGVSGFIVGAFLGNTFISAILKIGEKWESMDSGDKVTLFLGVFAGLIASVPFLFLFNAIIDQRYIFAVPLALLGTTLGFTMLSVYALQSMEEVLPWNRMRGKSKRRGIKILDTNVIIDGRIYDVARSGFLEGQLYVPGFVLEELQYIADSHDPLRRQRGRRGLDVLRHMQADFQLEVRTHDRLAPESGDDVDSRLVRLARAMGADVVTNDWNLNRVASLQEVKVLNINELSIALRPNVLPSESLQITIVREGNQPGQGVGYLDDGTMVVVDNGKSHLSETLSVIVTQVIQTERGKMIFAELDTSVDFEDQPQTPRRRPNGTRRH